MLTRAGQLDYFLNVLQFLSIFRLCVYVYVRVCVCARVFFFPEGQREHNGSSLCEGMCEGTAEAFYRLLLRSVI